MKKFLMLSLLLLSTSLIYAKEPPIFVKNNLPINESRHVVREQLVVVDFDSTFKTMSAGEYQWQVFMTNMNTGEVKAHNFSKFHMEENVRKNDRLVHGWVAPPGRYRVTLELHDLSPVIDDRTKKKISDSLKIFRTNYTTTITGF